MIRPLVFWLLGSGVVVFAVLAVGSWKPQRSLKALVAMMGTNTMVLVLAGAPLLAVELAVVVAAAVLVVWVVVIKGRKAKLGVPGRVRFGVAKMVAGCVALLLALELIARPLPSGARLEHTAYDVGPGGALVAVIVLISAAVSAVGLLAGTAGGKERGR